MWGAAAQGAGARGRGRQASGSVLCPPCVSEEAGGLTWLALALPCSGRASSVTAPGGAGQGGPGSCLDPLTPPTADVQSGSVMGPPPPRVRLPSPEPLPTDPWHALPARPAPRAAPPFPLQYKLSSGASAAGLELGRREQCWGGGSPGQVVGWESVGEVSPLLPASVLKP